MKSRLEELLQHIHDLQEEVEGVYLQAREEFERQRAELAAEFQRRQRSYKIGLLRFIVRARPLVVLTAPVIYLGWIPFLLLDLFVSLYQAVCFPVYGIPKARRGDFLVFDRERLPYLDRKSDG
jgi:hypothetical protein